jgi:pectin methylesterase-like acyl-CoA thioesterase
LDQLRDSHVSITLDVLRHSSIVYAEYKCVVYPSEKVIVPSTKTNVTLQGQGYTSTIIVWNDTASSAKGTQNSASVGVFADDFVAKNISFKVHHLTYFFHAHAVFFSHLLSKRHCNY